MVRRADKEISKQLDMVFVAGGDEQDDLVFPSSPVKKCRDKDYQILRCGVKGGCGIIDARGWQPLRFSLT